MGARAIVQPALGEELPFVFAFPAVVLVALQWGVGPALLTTSACVAWAFAPFVPPFVATSEMALQVGAFGVSAILTILVCSRFAGPAAPSPESSGLHADDTPLTRWLRAAVWGAALIPAVAFFSAAWWGYQKSFEDANRTAVRAGTVVMAHAERSFQTAEAVGRRANALAARPDEEIRQHRDEIDTRLNDLLLGLPGIEGLAIWDAKGELLASSRQSRPVAGLSIRDRAYFAKAQQPGTKEHVTGLLEGRLSGGHLFNVVLTRPAPDGGFGGVVTVSMQPRYFETFYRLLASEEPGLTTFSLFTADGDLLTRWPAPSASMTRVPDKSSLLARARSGEAHAVLFVGSTFDTERRLFSVNRVGSRPVYVSAGLSESFILAGWRRFIEILGAILLPVTGILVYVTWVALRKSQHEAAMQARVVQENLRREQAEGALMEAQKLSALAQLTGGVAHDFNNLLAVMANNLHILKRLQTDLSGNQQIAAMERALSSGVRLTRQLLSFSSRQAVHPEALVLQKWLLDARDVIATTLGPLIDLEITVEKGTSPIYVDASEFELALINLAVNAKDAMPHGGTLRIEAMNVPAQEGSSKEQVVVRATDTGTGMSPEIMGRVFDPFFSTKGPGKGTGLGLSQVHGFCKQAGGTASVASEPGRGTTVSLVLPAADAAMNRVAPLPLDAEKRNRLRGRVLLVEDNEDLAAGLESLLRSSGAGVRRTASGDQALSLVQAGEMFNGVVADIALPGALDGIQLAKRLSEHAPELRVLLITGYPARLKEATDAGLPVLAKPIDPDALLSKLDAMLMPSPLPSL